MHKYSYRNMVNTPSFIKEAPLDEWKELAKVIEIQLLHSKRLSGNLSSPDAIIDELTKDWPTTDREQFRYWYRNTRTASMKESSMQVKRADYSPLGMREEKDAFQEQRRSIVRRLRKLQNELSDVFERYSKVVEWRDSQYATPEAKQAAILSALNQICTILSILRTKEVTAASITRTHRFLNAVEPEAAKRFAIAINSEGGLKRIAANSAVYQLARSLKEEVDTLHYSTHLRRVFHIYEGLLRLGHLDLAKELEGILTKDLGDLAGLTEKLGQVYSDLLSIPAKQLAEEKSATEITPPNKEAFRTPKVTPEVSAG